MSFCLFLRCCFFLFCFFLGVSVVTCSVEAERSEVRAGRVRGASQNPVEGFLCLCSVAVLLSLLCFCMDIKSLVFFSSMENVFIPFLMSVSCGTNLNQSMLKPHLLCSLGWPLKWIAAFFLLSRPSHWFASVGLKIPAAAAAQGVAQFKCSTTPTAMQCSQKTPCGKKPRADPASGGR